jgi:lycopene cyclase domain-containing protein
MQMKYAYLLINFFTLLFPLALSFDKRVQFYKSWKYLWKGMSITGLFFLGWDILFTIKGVWSFNSKYITGVTVFQLPVEEILFFLTVPFACVFIYECLNYYVKWEINNLWSIQISNLLISFSILDIIYNYDKLYTVITYGLLLIIMLILRIVIKAEWLPRFYRAFIVILIPFYIINGFLTALPVVIYNSIDMMNKRVGTIPVEDHFYLIALLLMNVGFFEYFRRKNQTTNEQ